MRRDRGQLVLLAAAMLVVALIPLVTASLQLGYAADVDASSLEADGLADAELVLARSVHDAAASIPGSSRWAERTAAVDRVRSALRATVQAVNRSRLQTGVAGSVTYNATRAKRWATRACPGGPNRQFGRCVALEGIVVQNRANRTHVLAVAFDVTLVGDGRRQRHTRVLEVWPNRATDCEDGETCG